MATNKGKMRIYACGGAGVNQGKPLLNETLGEGFADLDIALVDTSHSNNIAGTIPDSAFYLLPNADGSGKKRSENHHEIANTVKDVLVKHKPAYFNVVVYSTSGGSGSVYGPLIQRELMQMGVPVVAVLIGNTTTAIEATNTVNTLKSLDNIARKCDVPAIVHYTSNTKTRSRKDVHKIVQQSILSLALKNSRLNEELDTTDVANWARFNNVSSVPAQLALLDIVVDEETAQAIIDPISVASIINVGEDATLEFAPDYGCVGYKDKKVSVETPELHFVISTHFVPEMFAAINKTAVQFDEVKAARPSQTALVGKNDNIADSDLIL